MFHIDMKMDKMDNHQPSIFHPNNNNQRKMLQVNPVDNIIPLYDSPNLDTNFYSLHQCRNTSVNSRCSHMCMNRKHHH